MALKFKNTKSPILINNIDINKIVVSNKFPFGKQDFKYCIGYKDYKETRPFHIFFREMSISKADKKYNTKNCFQYFCLAVICFH